MSRAEVQARSVADEFGLVSEPVDPEPVASKLGVIVVRQPTAPDVSGMLLRRDGRLVIGLNSNQPPARQRFALAHCLGHLKLHRSRDLILDTAARYSLGSLPSMPTDREEAEANRFAAGLLAPESAVRRAAVETSFTTGTELVEILAERFGMTVPAMGYRLMALGVVADI